MLAGRLCWAASLAGPAAAAAAAASAASVSPAAACIDEPHKALGGHALVFLAVVLFVVAAVVCYWVWLFFTFVSKNREYEAELAALEAADETAVAPDGSFHAPGSWVTPEAFRGQACVPGSSGGGPSGETGGGGMATLGAAAGAAVVVGAAAAGSGAAEVGGDLHAGEARASELASDGESLVTEAVELPEVQAGFKWARDAALHAGVRIEEAAEMVSEAAQQAAAAAQAARSGLEQFIEDYGIDVKIFEVLRDWTQMMSLFFSNIMPAFKISARIPP